MLLDHYSHMALRLIFMRGKCSPVREQHSGLAAVAWALLIVFTQILFAAEWSTVQWNGDAGFATTHFANTVGLICLESSRLYIASIKDFSVHLLIRCAQIALFSRESYGVDPKHD
jgi:hypothetical protein